MTMNDSYPKPIEVNLSKLFEDAYGSPAELADIMDIGLEMLFYVEEGVFSQRELQRVVGAIFKVKRILLENDYEENYSR